MAGPVCQRLSHLSEVGKEGMQGTTDSTDGCWYQACSRSSKSQIKKAPAPSLYLLHSLSLFLSLLTLLQSTPPLLCRFSHCLCLTLSNPVTLLQAPPHHRHHHPPPFVSISPSLPPTLSCVTVPSAGLLNSEAVEARGCGRLRPEW